MKVKTLTPTYWDGQRIKAGDVLDVDEKTGARWEKAGIAEKQVSKPPKNTGKE